MTTQKPLSETWPEDYGQRVIRMGEQIAALEREIARLKAEVERLLAENQSLEIGIEGFKNDKAAAPVAAPTDLLDLCEELLDASDAWDQWYWVAVLNKYAPERCLDSNGEPLITPPENGDEE